ncbi:MAG: hypothetical protein JEZ07_15020 [Phycisphaerae bacterium]|nr:hypothetical protein [Phycisphaerae bacterium]
MSNTFQQMPGKKITTRIHDRYGNIAAEISYDSGWYIDSSGIPKIISESTAIQLMDGSVWMPIHWQMQNGAVFIGVCDICRETKYSHGLVQLAKAKSCTCGKLICPVHAQKCSDGVFRCPDCHKGFSFKSFFRSLFFKEIKE